MWRIAGVMIAGMITCSVTAAPAAEVAPGSNEFQKYGEAVQGWWEGHSVSAFSDAGVAAAGERFCGNSSELWVLDKAAIECRWRSGDTCGRAYRFWDPVARRIRCLGIASNGTVVNVDITPQGTGWDEKVRITLADGTSFSGSSPRLVSQSGGIHFFEGTNWVSGDKKLPNSWDVWKKVPAPNIPEEAIELIESLVGNWVYEGTDGPDPVSGAISYEWAPGRHSVIEKGTYQLRGETSRGCSVFGWDHSRKQLVIRQYWTGGWSHTYAIGFKSQSLWEGEGRTSDDTGREMTAKVSWRFPAPGQFVWRMVDGVDKNGVAQPPMELHGTKVRPDGVQFVSPPLLKEYGKVMVGDWEMPEIVLAQDLPGVGKKGDKVAGRASCRWILDGAALAWEGQFGGVSGKFLNYWDPLAKQIKGFGVDATGTISEEVVTKEGERLVSKSETVFPDGKRRRVTDTLIIEQGGATHIHVGSDNTVDGVPQPGYRDVWKRVNK